MKTTMNRTVLEQLVLPTKINKRVYVDEEIFELEMERIWGQAWIFIGHESQVPEPGDYFTTNINHKVPVIMVRDIDSRVHVLHNRCAHKGAKIVTSRTGNSPRAFRCGYHGWTYRHDGKLLKLPNDIGYENTGFNLNDSCNNLQSLAQTERYRGCIFATLSANAPDLKTRLGGAVDCFDNL